MDSAKASHAQAILRIFAMQLSDAPLPGRLNTESVAQLLGFSVSDISVLLQAGLLKPLGDPAQNSTKMFALASVIRLAADPNWLSKATEVVGTHWRNLRRPAMGEVEMTKIEAPNPSVESEALH